MHFLPDQDVWVNLHNPTKHECNNNCSNVFSDLEGNVVDVSHFPDIHSDSDTEVCLKFKDSGKVEDELCDSTKSAVCQRSSCTGKCPSHHSGTKSCLPLMLLGRRILTHCPLS